MFRASTGDAVLCDLGVGRISQGGGGDTAAATAYEGRGGTLLYFSPELLEKDERAATRASDMYVQRRSSL